jgi:hypothetical protein
MQRLFTMFPGGVPGLALMLLRLAVTGSLWQPLLEGSASIALIRLLSVSTASVFILVGLATPLLGTIITLFQLAKAIDPLTLDPIVSADTLTPAIYATIALSLALIGPGAFSLDARLFGRRILTSSED